MLMLSLSIQPLFLDHDHTFELVPVTEDGYPELYMQAPMLNHIPFLRMPDAALKVRQSNDQGRVMPAAAGGVIGQIVREHSMHEVSTPM